MNGPLTEEACGTAAPDTVRESIEARCGEDRCSTAYLTEDSVMIRIALIMYTAHSRPGANRALRRHDRAAHRYHPASSRLSWRWWKSKCWVGKW
jgi:hypothetical protein